MLEKNIVPSLRYCTLVIAMVHPNKPDSEKYPDIETEERDGLVPLYWVVMHNDPVTTMDFVVLVLMQIFGYDPANAEETMYRIHHNGLEKIALMPLERAEFKVSAVHRAARASGFPLTCTIEPE